MGSVLLGGRSELEIICRFRRRVEDLGFRVDFSCPLKQDQKTATRILAPSIHVEVLGKGGIWGSGISAHMFGIYRRFSATPP